MMSSPQGPPPTAWCGQCKFHPGGWRYAAQCHREVSLPKEAKNLQVFRNPYVWGRVSFRTRLAVLGKALGPGPGEGLPGTLQFPSPTSLLTQGWWRASAVRPFHLPVFWRVSRCCLLTSQGLWSPGGKSASCLGHLLLPWSSQIVFFLRCRPVSTYILWNLLVLVSLVKF